MQTGGIIHTTGPHSPITILKEFLVKKHTFIARKGFNKQDGTFIAKGEVFECKVNPFVAGRIEFFSLYFDENDPTKIPCAYVAFHSRVDLPTEG